MKLTIIGASRGIGRRAVDEALLRGHAVRAMARSMSKAGIEAPGFTAIDGDATAPEDVARAIEGADAVILTLGIVPLYLSNVPLRALLGQTDARARVPAEST